MSRGVGLTNTEAAFDYIQLYRGDTETLAASLDRIQKTAASILESLNQESEAESLAA